MRLASFLVDGAPSYGVITDAGAHPALPALRASCPTLRDYLRTRPVADLPGQCGAALSLEGLVWLPPIPEPGKILCAGMNYRKPYPVAGVAPPDPGHVVLFSRHPQTLMGHRAKLEMPQGAAAESFDFEGEIVAVIGQPGRHITPEAALGHVLGYSAMNEGSVRGWMKHSVHAGKNFHASGSWGPWITTADETGDIAEMTLQTRVNGTLMQSDSGAGMIFGLAELIAYISHIQPLEAGDIIATGSPDGTGGSRTPPAFLRPGDRVAVTVGGVGTLENTVGAS